jgi:hypothetical protein
MAEAISKDGKVAMSISVPPASEWYESSTGTTLLAESGTVDVQCHGVPCVVQYTLRTTKSSKARMQGIADRAGKK